MKPLLSFTAALVSAIALGAFGITAHAAPVGEGLGPVPSESGLGPVKDDGLGPVRDAGLGPVRGAVPAPGLGPVK